MGEVGLVGCAGFLVEGTGGWGCILSFWWAGLHLVVYFGLSVNLMILGSLSANGWGCVPVLLAVLHGESRTGAGWPFDGAGS